MNTMNTKWGHSQRAAGCLAQTALLAASLGFIATASAADLGGLLKAPPVLPDLTWQGVTVFGTYDIAGQYESIGAPTGGNGAAGIITNMNRAPQWLLVPNQSSQSAVGVKIDRSITEQTHFIARFETGFNSTTGELSDTLKGMQKNNGIPLNQQTVNGGGPRAGQIINGEAWAGFADKTWGTLHVGRNNMISTDMVGACDPLASYGFSLIGYFGLLAGQGSSDTARIDTSVKYYNSYGPWRMSAIYGNPGTNVNEFYQGSVGIVRPNFSVDLVAGHGSDLVSTFALSGAANLNSRFLGAKVFDTDMYGAFGKYVFDLGRNGLQDPAERKFTITGGHSRIGFYNPADGGFAPAMQRSEVTKSARYCPPTNRPGPESSTTHSPVAIASSISVSSPASTNTTHSGRPPSDTIDTIRNPTASGSTRFPGSSRQVIRKRRAPASTAPATSKCCRFESTTTGPKTSGSMPASHTLRLAAGSRMDT